VKNMLGRTPLHEAAFYGERSAAQFLIDHGANIHSIDGSGATPLHLAAQSALAEMVNLLIDNGASVDFTTPRGYTPLHYAIRAHIMRHEIQYYLTTIETLLCRGANVMAQTADSKGPLELAQAKPNYPEIAELLIRYGAK
jgi:ankyrin repeat protein